ncbi:MAG: hypothetical protein CME59_06915 [Halioglobus sp.]|nr:hypothetical protein [Halioglobus sp.]
MVAGSRAAATGGCPAAGVAGAGRGAGAAGAGGGAGGGAGVAAGAGGSSSSCASTLLSPWRMRLYLSHTLATCGAVGATDGAAAMTRPGAAPATSHVRASKRCLCATVMCSRCAANKRGQHSKGTPGVEPLHISGRIKARFRAG